MAFLPVENKVGKLMGNYLTNVIGSSMPLLYNWVAANYAGHTKKVRLTLTDINLKPCVVGKPHKQVTMNATLLIAFCVGNSIGPLTFRDADAPDYLPAKATIVAVCSTAVVLTIMLQMYYIWENKRRDRLVREGLIEHKVDVEFSDLINIENKEFRYRL